MRKSVTILALALLALLSACTRGRMLPPREVDVDGKFSLSIPANLVPCNDLHDFAPLQFADERGGFFLVGIEEPKSKIEALQVHYTLGDYAYFVESTIGGAFDTVHVSQRDTLEINGLQCHTADLYAAVISEEAPLEVYYHLTVFEAEDRFYQLIGWTDRDRQSTYRAAAEAMDRTFRVCGSTASQTQTALAASPR
ncbi:MAG TPA: hypothetical protein VHS96_13560 [Bacteroidia bacterium]|nr:hypothetical protein [Bacteroidia bacterium]